MFRFLTRTSFVLIILGAAPVAAQQADQALNSVVFTCERGVHVPVTFINAPDAPGYAIAQIDGHQIAMAQVPSGSGIRYRAVNPDQPYEFHGKGNEGLFLYGPEDDAITLLGDCVAE